MRWGHTNPAFEVRGAQAYQVSSTLEFGFMEPDHTQKSLVTPALQPHHPPKMNVKISPAAISD
jgi:hypothetical protein